MKKMKNQTYIEGLLYEHALEAKVSGPNSKAPGTSFISGTISIATNNALTNIVPIHFTYVTETTGKEPNKKPNPTYTLLKQIIDGQVPMVTAGGADVAAKLRVDSAIGLNEYYSNRNGGEPEFVSTKRNEGGFVHLTNVLKDDELKRSKFEADMVMTNVRIVDADEARGLPARAIIKGAIFDFRGSLLPVDFTVVHPGAMSYFESLEPSAKNPVLMYVRGQIIYDVITRKTEKTTPWGTTEIVEQPSNYRDWVIDYSEAPMEWDDESTITAEEMKTAMANRQLTLASIKQRYDEYQETRKSNVPQPAATPTKATSTVVIDDNNFGF